MDKKEYLVTLLEKLSGTWTYALWLKLIVEQADVDDSVIDGIYAILSEAIHETTESMKKESMIKSLEILKKLKENSQSDQDTLDQEFDNLLNNI